MRSVARDSTGFIIVKYPISCVKFFEMLDFFSAFATIAVSSEDNRRSLSPVQESCKLYCLVFGRTRAYFY